MRRIKQIVIIAGWLVVWQLISCLVGNEILLSGPLETGKALITCMMKGSFWQTTAYSVLRIATGFLAGAFVGLLLAALSARFPLLAEILSPVFTLIKAIPVASFVVLFLIWWRSDVLACVISFFVVLPSIYINTLEGIQSTDQELLEMAQVFDIGGWNRFFYIYRPALKPFLDSSIRTCVGMSWKAGVAAEVIGTPAFSIGGELYMAKIYLETADVLAWTGVTIVLSCLFEKGVLFLWEYFGNWQPPCKKTRQSRTQFLQENIKTQKMALSVKELTKSFGGQMVSELAGLSANYEWGNCYYFHSPSGSGKTTYFRLLAKLEKPDKGEIVISGQSSGIGMVFQEDRLCERYSAVKNVAMVTGDEASARIHLAKLGLSEEDMRKTCQELSGGMKRRVAIARAFASQRDILLLDEPFTGLDKHTREVVERYIEQEKGSRCLLIATHI